MGFFSPGVIIGAASTFVGQVEEEREYNRDLAEEHRRERQKNQALTDRLRAKRKSDDAKLSQIATSLLGQYGGDRADEVKQALGSEGLAAFGAEYESYVKTSQNQRLTPNPRGFVQRLIAQSSTEDGVVNPYRTEQVAKADTTDSLEQTQESFVDRFKESLTGGGKVRESSAALAQSEAALAEAQQPRVAESVVGSVSPKLSRGQLRNLTKAIGEKFGRKFSDVELAEESTKALSKAVVDTLRASKAKEPQIQRQKVIAEVILNNSDLLTVEDQDVALQAINILANQVKGESLPANIIAEIRRDGLTKVVEKYAEKAPAEKPTAQKTPRKAESSAVAGTLTAAQFEERFPDEDAREDALKKSYTRQPAPGGKNEYIYVPR
jgi:hypothetical protein